MRRTGAGSDDTVRVVPRPAGRLRTAVAVAALAVAVLGGGIAGWLLRTSPPARVPQPAVVVRPLAVPVETADARQIRDHVPTGLTVFRLAANPHILVLDFASLREQGLMLNRVAALVEKAALPRDRVLPDAELEAAIRARGDTVETFYYGHDYAAAELARFFALADRQHVALDAEEGRLRALLRQEGWLTPGVAAGLISLPAAGSNATVTPEARAAILQHELAHGEFFSNPAYADYVRGFWRTALTAQERAAFRGFLAKDGYDAGDETLMYNEMQAYLMFTRSPLFFAPSMIGMTGDRLAALRADFLQGMPHDWLRDTLASYKDAARTP